MPVAQDDPIPVRHETAASITVAICTYRRYDLLRRAVASCLRQTLDPESYRILIVDNIPSVHRSDAEKKYHEHDPRIRYLTCPRANLCLARNLAADSCETPFLAYLDDDAEACPEWLEAILNGFQLHGPEVGIVGGRIEPLWESAPPSWLHRNLFGFLSLVDWGGKEPRHASKEEWFAGANVAFRTKLISRMGYFDERLGRVGAGGTLMSNDEKDLMTRIESAGFARVYAPRASVSHWIPNERLRQSWFRKRVAWQAASELTLDYQGAAAWAHTVGWERVSEFLANLPPTLRTLAALHQPTPDAAAFGRQLDALYAQTLLALTGFETAGC